MPDGEAIEDASALNIKTSSESDSRHQRRLVGNCQYQRAKEPGERPLLRATRKKQIPLDDTPASHAEVPGSAIEHSQRHRDANWLEPQIPVQQQLLILINVFAVDFNDPAFRTEAIKAFVKPTGKLLTSENHFVRSRVENRIEYKIVQLFWPTLHKKG